MSYSEVTEDLLKTCFTLVKYNNGFFKSDKQERFLKKQFEVYSHIHTDSKQTEGFFGIELSDGQWLVMLERHVSFGPGIKSQRWVTWMFVFDGDGIVKRYRGHRSYDRGASSIDSTKTALEWQRPKDVLSTKKVTVVEEPTEQKSNEWIGTVGKKVTGLFIVKQVAEYYGSYGAGKRVKMETQEGNEVTVFTTSAAFTDLEEGKMIEMVGTVKNHGEFRDRKQTILSRCTIVNVF